MSESPEADKSTAKTAKKAGKAEVKRLKKEAKGGFPSAAPAPPPAGQPGSGPTTAERSAAAAERQVKLQERRVFWSTLGVIVALATLLVSLIVWFSSPTAPARTSTPAATQPG